jgi:hypothetical protein
MLLVTLLVLFVNHPDDGEKREDVSSGRHGVC